MKKIITCIFIMIATLGNANATTISLSFPELTGTYIYGDLAQTTSFDFGVQFSSIQNATIEVTATGTAGLMKTCLASNPLDCSTSSFGPEAYYSFEWESGFGLPPSGSLAPFTSTPATHQDNLIQPLRDIEFLLDGTGVLRLGHVGIFVVDIYTLEILTPAEFEISDVTLTVEGTVVPLPATAWLFGSGLIGLVGLSRHKKKF